MTVFGDSEPADAFDADAPNADPEQVAVRWHEIRIQRGQPLSHWPDLSDDDRAEAVHVVQLVAAWLHEQGVRL